MTTKIAALLVVAVTFGSLLSDEASAAHRRGGVRMGSRLSYAPVTPPTTILPTREELRLRAPGQGRVIGYALNLYPSSRMVRLVLGR